MTEHRIWIGVISALAWAGLALGQTALPQATNAPKLYCPEPAFDFGEKDESVPVVHEFRIRNVGAAPLVIHGVRTSCGCTAAQPSTNMVPPGGETSIKATLSLVGRRGLQNKVISVESNDPAQPVARLTLNGTAVVELAVEPSFISFGNLEATTNAEREVRLISRRSGVQITNVTCDSPDFRVQKLPATPGQPPGVKVSTVPPLPLGESRGVLRIYTDHPKRGEVTATVRALVLPEVRVLPDEIIVRGEVGAVAPRVSLLLIPCSVRDYQVLNVEPPAGIAAQFKQSAPGTYRIDLLNVPTGPEMNGQTVRISTTLTKMKEIAVRIRHAP